MSYHVELDISNEPSFEKVQEFAKGLNCSATLLQENGPAGGMPVYEFSSENYNSLVELVEQIFESPGFDPEFYKALIVEK